ncbi:MAG: DUF839 domain-containing protein [Bacteroidetes bacterium]|nr:DUF839 domain-containing protein [Bacteroidota bacterium]
MKLNLGLIVGCFFAGATSYGQQIHEFVSYGPASQTGLLKLPCSHTFQLILKEGQVLSDGTSLPGSADFAAYFETSPDTGILMLNHEIIAGYVTRHSLTFDQAQQLWSVNSSGYVNFADVVGTYRPCSGGITPWGTLFSGEELVTAADANADAYLDAGWLFEVDPITGMLPDPDGNGVKDKNWAMGRMVHENVCFSSDSLTAYFGADQTSTGYLYKFVADTKTDFSSGTLYVLKKTSLLAPTGDWIQVPNTTPDERDSVSNYATAIGATNFNRIEDVEIGPDGKIYFAATANGRIYRLADQDTTVAGFETYVNNQIYTVQTVSGPASFTWGAGTDNLCFDHDGNLWALQDNAFGYILVVGSDHTMANPKIRIFGQSPAGSEPTGINFSPDGNYLFLSLQHPTTSNTLVNSDAAENNVVFNKSATVVIARKEYLGHETDAAFTSLPASVCLSTDSIPITTNAYSGTITGTGILNDTFFVELAGVGAHVIQFVYSDSAACNLYLHDTIVVHDLPDLVVTTDTAVCYYDSLVTLTASFPFTTFGGSGISVDGTYNPQNLGPGVHSAWANYTNEFSCADSDTVFFEVTTPVFPEITGLDSTYCKNAVPDTFSIVPATAVFTQQTGISGFVFNPSTTSGSAAAFELEYGDSMGCVYHTAFSILIHEPQQNSISGMPAIACQNEDTVALALLPAGGILMGTGTFDSALIPSQMPAGMNSISYTTVDSNNCSFTSTETIFIVVPAPVDAGADEVVCLTQAVQLTGFPAGGTWTGFQCNSAGLVTVTTAGTFDYVYSLTDANGCDTRDTVTLVVADCLGTDAPMNHSNLRVFPNPASSSVTFTYTLSTNAAVTLSLMDLAGHVVLTDDFGTQQEGSYSKTVNVSDVANGLYFYTLSVNGVTSTEKLTIAHN